jgi:hypothetical protein
VLDAALLNASELGEGKEESHAGKREHHPAQLFTIWCDHIIDYLDDFGCHRRSSPEDGERRS